MKRVVWGSVAFGLAAALGAGIPAAGAAPAPLVFMLDWFPNPDHVPLFAAQQEGWFTQEGLRVTLQIPANTDDPLKLAAAGRVDVAVNYEPNVIIARAQGLPVRSVGVLVGQPLITIMFLKSSGIRSPRDLVGRRVGFAVTGFADAMVDQMMHSAGAGVRPVACRAQGHSAGGARGHPVHEPVPVGPRCRSTRRRGQARWTGSSTVTRKTSTA